MCYTGFERNSIRAEPCVCVESKDYEKKTILSVVQAENDNIILSYYFHANI